MNNEFNINVFSHDANFCSALALECNKYGFELSFFETNKLYTLKTFFLSSKPHNFFLSFVVLPINLFGDSRRPIHYNCQTNFQRVQCQILFEILMMAEHVR